MSQKVVLVPPDGGIVPMQQSELFAARMREVGVECKLVVAKGEGHGWKTPLPYESSEITQWFGRHLLRQKEVASPPNQ